ncbi:MULTISPECIES: DUF1236 domain-containing protein [Rhizobiaceae]|uniref:DUF1236 domain-containing protein n=1 Tax=Peteryoungia algae TaxID=2919917 RepID=A0ABT0CYU3_9HYPH|nr:MULTISPECIES: DUF1236 domain-containing protein [unclassified Rhizobium]MCC8932363.1 DUF1236 domain-containing protein [Rhizobium sp. 'Codium 1']MCJ8238345.1 DUF1236 domain-containing protein [Rhizobium sp. SSM4.3]
MKTKIIALGAILIGAVASPVAAQEGTVTGAAGGAVTGAIVGGPVGAAVGGVVGAIAGTAVDPPPQRVVTYVQQQPVPAQPVVIERQVVVGEPLPQEIVLTTIPEDPAYAYAVVNNQRVIVDPQTYVVVGVVQ